MEELDLMGTNEQPRKHINTLVARQIKESSSTANSDPLLVLVSFTYFKGNQEKLFKKEEHSGNSYQGHRE